MQIPYQLQCVAMYFILCTLRLDFGGSLHLEELMHIAYCNTTEKFLVFWFFLIFPVAGNRTRHLRHPNLTLYPMS